MLLFLLITFILDDMLSNNHFSVNLASLSNSCVL